MRLLRQDGDNAARTPPHVPRLHSCISIGLASAIGWNRLVGEAARAIHPGHLDGCSPVELVDEPRHGFGPSFPVGQAASPSYHHDRESQTMIYVLAFVVLLLAAAVTVLFAMLGELYTRIGGPTQPIQSLASDRIGQSPASWPNELAGIAALPEAVLLVLSTSCSSCINVARQLQGRGSLLHGYEMRVLLSSPDRKQGEAFAQNHLATDSFFIDVGGEWVTEAFGVDTSPSALLLRGGELASVFAFADLMALQTAFPSTDRG